ncbi:MAG: alpha-glucosidase [Flavobacteriales bacterium]|nr:alpha-glucosidase [Flavobacteriales bacterium]
MKYTKNLLYLLLLVSFLNTSCSEKQTKQTIINCDSNVNIYYPPGYDKSSHTPSFAILNEPLEMDKVSDSSSLKVSFSEFSDRQIAQVSFGSNVDLYGTGEVMGDLIRNGKTVKLWNTDNYGYGKDNGQRLYQSHPWVLGVGENGKSFGVIADNTWKMEISLGERITFSSEGPAFRVIVIEKDSPQEVMKELGKLTGTIELPPLWSLGFHQCRYSYYPDERVKSLADTMRLKNIPCDVIWMDIDYMQDFKIFTFDSIHFPNPTETNDYLHQKDFKSVWMIDPGIKAEKGYFVYDSGEKINAWVMTRNDSVFLGKVWPGDCVFPDFTQSKVSKWWGGLYKNFMAKGVDGVWNDMNEPAVFETVDWTMPDSNKHLGDENIKNDIHLRYHNVYGMMMVESSRKGIIKSNPEKRPFVLTRSNFLGGHRYAATWTGDNNSSMKHLKQSIPMSLNLSLSGQPFNGPDIGGFAGNATPELYAHWIAVGAFYPFSRAHSTKGSINQEPWSFGEEVETVSREALQRRYRLLPYLYTLFWESANTGMPVMRPVFFNNPAEKYLRTEQENFLLGSDLLIVPKWSENGQIPKGNWRNVSINGEKSQNHKYHPDILIRPGAIVPLCNPIVSTNSFSLDTITLLVSLDTNLYAKGVLYSDFGEGYGYQNGEFSLVEFYAETQNGTTTLKTKTLDGNSFPIDTKINIQLIMDGEIRNSFGLIEEPIVINN